MGNVGNSEAWWRAEQQGGQRELTVGLGRHFMQKRRDTVKNREGETNTTL